MEAGGFTRRRIISKGLVILILICIPFLPCHAFSENSRIKAGTLASAPEVFSHERYLLYESPVSFVLLFPGIIVCLAIVLFPKRKSNPGKKVLTAFFAILTLSMISASYENTSRSIFTKGVNEYTAGHYGEARLLFEKLKVKAIELPYLRYNIALCYISEHNVAGALLELYSGLRRSSTEPVLLEAIASIEQKEGLANQFVPGPAFEPNVPFCAALGLWNLGFILFGSYLRTKKRVLLTLVVSCTVLFVTIAGVAGYSMSAASRQFGIVCTKDAVMKKIPLADFREDKKIQEGTSLRVYGQANGYVLTETGTGLKGWIKKEDLFTGEG